MGSFACLFPQKMFQIATTLVVFYIRYYPKNLDGFKECFAEGFEGFLKC